MVATAFTRLLEAETEKLLACVHCGLCLPHCPTYVQQGDENDSPRGRLYLMRAVAEGRLSPTADAFRRHIDLCVGCRACETACPSGVRYGHLLETARHQIIEARGTQRSWQERLIRWLMRQIFTSPRRLRMLFSIARVLRRSAIVQMLIDEQIIPARPSILRKGLAMVLATEPGSWQPPEALVTSSSDERHKPAAAGSPRLALFAGCVVRELFAHTNRATINVLRAHGCLVDDPSGQVCCGALHAHTGDLETARQLAKENIEVFEAEHFDAIIVNAAGCGAMLKEYGTLLGDDQKFAERARTFSSKVRDICEFLAQHGFAPGPTPVNVRVTYDAPCHLHHAQQVIHEPLELIRKIPGIEFVPLPQAESCCGSAGIYNLLHAEMAEAILQKKLAAIRSTQAQIVLTGNAGCLMHIGSGARLEGLSVQVMHPIELIARTYTK
ncbi:MAG: heterodisulfide reductase-related iron-sulfur binding cluster [Acidobacteriota bacterium]|nr:heterodisulfide reductase-related iron-sulfur binding cluster [Blastocatellia bacterium]MDW8240356.1 heterodisulfide reductase-related iron-sulfur binding cluster [Acidobacteriota bacterium]